MDDRVGWSPCMLSNYADGKCFIFLKECLIAGNFGRKMEEIRRIK